MTHEILEHAKAFKPLEINSNKHYEMCRRYSIKNYKDFSVGGDELPDTYFEGKTNINIYVEDSEECFTLGFVDDNIVLNELAKEFNDTSILDYVFEYISYDLEFDIDTKQPVKLTIYFDNYYEYSIDFYLPKEMIKIIEFQQVYG